ncbi:MAG TPA: T9SS type A sorting domain-containing protein [Chitinophagaceae bacterium]|nr:T9SS type A sorting domain-containing protein [Chitinophagaceae bacterium]
MKSKKLLFSSLLAVGSMIAYLTLTSSAGGQMGVATSGCGGSSCHGGAANAATSIALTGIPAGGYTPGTAYNVTLSVTNMSLGKAGFDLSVSGGTLSNNNTATTMLMGSELHHTTPANAVSGVSTWTFTWTAPASGTVNFNISANAVNGNTQQTGDVWNKVTLPFSPASSASAPTVTAPAAVSITSSSASITSTVNANGATTDVIVEYGTSATYGQSVTMTPPQVTGTTATSVIGSLLGLTQNTMYHYRVRAINSVDTTYSTDKTFTTLMGTGLTEYNSDAFAIYPNPSSDFVSIESTQGDMIQSVQVLNLQGQICHTAVEMNNASKAIVSLHSLVNGYYVVKVRTEKQTFIYPITKK